MPRSVTVAAVQFACTDDETQNLQTAERLIREAHARGANIILLQELFSGFYFCQAQCATNFQRARPRHNHPAITRMQQLAAELQVVLPVSFFERSGGEPENSAGGGGGVSGGGGGGGGGVAHFNSLVVIDADGKDLGLYRKSHIPDGPGYQEKFYFSPGDSGFKVFKTRYAAIGCGICWDQWFPEAARVMALKGAELLLYPTAIGSEPQDASIDSQPHWSTVMRGHAAANLMPVIASNRIGTETISTERGPSTITFYGSSFVAGRADWGDVAAGRAGGGGCFGTGTTRQVEYKKVRDCKDPFPIQEIHDEPCTCTPEDYTLQYKTTPGPNCTEEFVPNAGCSSGSVTGKVSVNPFFCELNSVPCTKAHMRVAYSQCMGESGITVSTADGEKPAAQVIYFFNKSCNPAAKGSAHLPPITYIPCDTKCGPGSFLHADKCKICTPGTYSMGGGLRFDKIYELDKKYFKTTCEFFNSTGKHTCEPWYVEDGAVKVGAYDSPNEWLQDECDTDEDYECHNNLRSVLQMTVRLVRPGYVKFNYTVNAEKGLDGLSFFIDVSEQPVMPLDSYQFHPKQVMFNLTEGYHHLTWLYSKDHEFTRGQDTAAITMIEVDGTDYNDHRCRPCEPGFYSAEGATECIPCPLDHISKGGAAQCEACPENSYALHVPRIKCLPKPTCSLEKHARYTYTPCMSATNTRTKKYEWVEPKVCTGGDVLPPEDSQTCPPCPSGQYYEDSPENGTKACVFCPPGSARDASNETMGNACERCEPGNVAIKSFKLEHFARQHGGLPEGFTTGCRGQCGSPGWHVVNERLESGVGHGQSVSVWLKYEVDMEMDGQVTFNYSAHLPEGDTQRGLFFYVDEDLVVASEEGYEEGEPDTVVTTDPWELRKGKHTLMWVWIKLQDQQNDTTDGAIIYDILIDAATRGGASYCEPVPEGAELAGQGSFWTECPAGFYSEGLAANCTACPPNTFNDMPFGSKASCQPCSPGTTSLAGSSECTIGDVAVPSSYCSYVPPASEEDAKLPLTIFDLSPLSRRHPGRMFGPIFDNPKAKNRSEGSLYYVNVCDRDKTNRTCASVRGVPMNTYACKINPATKLDNRQGHRLAHNLGKKIDLSPLGQGAALFRRGFVMTMTGDTCVAEDKDRELKITFICDPNAGYGAPEAWTEKGQQAALDPALTFPSWVDRTGAIIPIGNETSCTYDMVWYSAFACPMCTYDDYEMVTVPNCKNNKFVVFKYKEPKLCQPNPQAPLPDDIPCQPCAGFLTSSSTCADVHGRHNITYTYEEEGSCNPNLNGSVKLPAPVIVGPCVQTLYIESAELLNGKYVLLGALGGVLALVLLVVWVVTYIKSRRLYSAYSKLVEEQEHGGGDGEGEGPGGGAELQEVEMAGNERTRFTQDETDNKY
ncbi:unnamed protein product [Closterium sp. Naga37s-1]|nr:unnamed protein product [Closterium sp. Naga37s-1]